MKNELLLRLHFITRYKNSCRQRTRMMLDMCTPMLCGDICYLTYLLETCATKTFVFFYAIYAFRLKFFLVCSFNHFAPLLYKTLHNIDDKNLMMIYATYCMCFGIHPHLFIYSCCHSDLFLHFYWHFVMCCWHFQWENWISSPCDFLPSRRTKVNLPWLRQACLSPQVIIGSLISTELLMQTIRTLSESWFKCLSCWLG